MDAATFATIASGIAFVSAMIVLYRVYILAHTPPPNQEDRLRPILELLIFPNLPAPLDGSGTQTSGSHALKQQLAGLNESFDGWKAKVQRSFSKFTIILSENNRHARELERLAQTLENEAALNPESAQNRLWAKAVEVARHVVTATDGDLDKDRDDKGIQQHLERVVLAAGLTLDDPRPGNLVEYPATGRKESVKAVRIRGLKYPNGSVVMPPDLGVRY